MPKRTSLPSMLPPACMRAGLLDRRPRAASAGLPRLLAPDSTCQQRHKDHEHRRQARPSLAACRRPSRRMCNTSAAGISRIDSSSKKFDSGVGFSNGCAELTLKNPPPLVPSCLIAICDAAGPTGDRLFGERRGLCRRLSVASRPVAVVASTALGTSSAERCNLRVGTKFERRPAKPAPAPGRSTTAAGCRACCA